MIIFLLVGHQPGSVGLDYTVSLPLLPIWLWFLLYTFSCRRSFFASLQVILINSCSANSFNFGVPRGGGELRVFLLYHLVYTPQSIF